MKVRVFFMRFFLVFFCCSSLVVLFLKYLEYTSIFSPGHKLGATPESIGIFFDEVWLLTEDGLRIHGWFIDSNSRGHTLLFCHGNAGTISSRLDKIKLFHQLGLSVFIFDYRGYGLSKGLPSENGLYCDAEAAYRYLIETRGIPPLEIIVYGESLGGAVAIELAMRKKFQAAIIDSTFTSIVDMGNILYPGLPKFFINNHFDSIAKVSFLKLPKLFIHSASDDLIPLSHAEKLFSYAAYPKELLVISGGHNEAFLISLSNYKKALRRFLGQLKKPFFSPNSL